MGDVIIYEEANKTVNEDGVVIESKEKTITELSKSPQFMKVFTRDIGGLNNVSSGACKLLFGLFRYVDRDNEIIVNASRKSTIKELIGIATSSQDMYLGELVKKDVLHRICRGTYVLNPYIFGKASWEGIRELRTVTTYDFDKLTKKVEFIRTETIAEE